MTIADRVDLSNNTTLFRFTFAGMHRTTYSYILSFGPHSLPLPVRVYMVYGSHSAWGTVYVPFFCGHQGMSPAYSVGSPITVDRGSAYWAHRCVCVLTCLYIYLIYMCVSVCVYVCVIIRHSFQIFSCYFTKED